MSSEILRQQADYRLGRRLSNRDTRKGSRKRIPSSEPRNWGYSIQHVGPRFTQILKLARSPHSLAATLAALPSMSLNPFAPLKLVRYPR